jgi:hypothetical protein
VFDIAIEGSKELESTELCWLWLVIDAILSETVADPETRVLDRLLVEELVFIAESKDIKGLDEVLQSVEEG